MNRTTEDSMPNVAFIMADKNEERGFSEKAAELVEYIFGKDMEISTEEGTMMENDVLVTSKGLRKKFPSKTFKELNSRKRKRKTRLYKNADIEK